MTEQPRFIILGTGGTFTFHVIQTLIEQQAVPLAYIQSGSKPNNINTTFADIRLEINKPQNALSQLLEFSKVAVYFKSEIELSKIIKQLNVEFLLVACWPDLIPDNILQSVSKAALNLHPSLLPKFRGIDPITEQLNTTDCNFGISLHLLNERFDEGDIVFQQSIDFEQNFEKQEIERLCAIKGAHLFKRAINVYSTAAWSPTKQISLNR